VCGNKHHQASRIAWRRTKPREARSTPIDDGVENDLDGVGVSEVDDLHGVLHNADCRDLFPFAPVVHHEGVGQELDNGALRLG
jgi:hypothetical protein